MSRWFILLLGLATITVALIGCSEDAAVGPGTGIVADTSSLVFASFHYTGYDADGEVETGLTLQWTLAFESTTGRDCRIQKYCLLDVDSVEIHRRENPTIRYVSDGGSLSDKEVWIPLDGPTSSGDYILTVYYETGRLLDKGGESPDWSGPLSSGIVSMPFTVVPKR